MKMNFLCLSLQNMGGAKVNALCLSFTSGNNDIFTCWMACNVIFVVLHTEFT